MLEVGDHGLRELLGRRHLQVVVAISQGADQQTLFRIARDDRRPRIATFQQPFTAIDAKTVLSLRAAVAFDAGGRQHGADSRFKERLTLVGSGIGVRTNGQTAANENCESHEESHVACHRWDRSTYFDATHHNMDVRRFETTGTDNLLAIISIRNSGL